MGARLSDPVAEAVAALERGHRLFAGPSVPVGVIAGEHGAHADRITAATSAGVPAAVAAKSGSAVNALHRLAGVDGQLTAVINEAQAGRDRASHATRVILDAAKADTIPGGDTALGQREALRRMIARLRAQHGHVTRSRAQSIALAARLRRLLYLRQRALAGGGGLDAGPVPGGDRGATLSAIRTALDIKGIHDPVARARWERGMDTVAKRESNYRNDAVNHVDSNARAGHPSEGTFQFIPSTFAAYHEPGTSHSMSDRVAQACAFINYARGRYGVALDGSNLASRIQQADPHRSPKGY